MAKVGAFLKAFLHPSYTATMNGQSGAIVYLMPHMTCSMAPLPPLLMA